MKCMYCLEEKNGDAFNKAEHVIPQSFGVFLNNLTLHDMVCDDCNQHFGETLELDLARDTFEGAARYDFGVKDPREHKTVGTRSRMSRTVQEGPFKGAYGYPIYEKEANKVVLAPLPQVGLRNVESQYEFFLLDNIPSKDFLEEQGFKLDQPPGIIFPPEFEQEAIEKLEEQGITWKATEATFQGASSTGEWLCEVEGKIDQTIFRAIAKIGFNYLAYWEGAEFVLDEGFNPVRGYIRRGEITAYPLVDILDRSILADERGNSKRLLGHLVTVNWANDGVSIVSQVSLFNWVTYSVCLARDFSGKHKDIARGHFFNTSGKEIVPLEIRNQGIW